MGTQKLEDVLVSTAWVEKHKGDTGIRIVEVDVDTTAYGEGHIEGSMAWNWQTQLCDTLRRDIIPEDKLEKLLSDSGIGNEDTIVLYGDNNNWFACWAFWQLKMYGHKDVRIMDGGRKKWIAEARPLTDGIPSIERKKYLLPEPDFSMRSFLTDVMTKQNTGKNMTLVDVRSPDEFTGKILSPPGLPETCQRGGHIPQAVNIPWGKNCNEDGTFKSPDELRSLYESMGVTRDKDVITYCRIGERSSLSWFAMKYLLGFDKVTNYDGSWTEWGNLVNAPVER